MYRSLMLFFALVPLLIPAVQAAPHRNVLLLISDNQNWDDCGCYGNPVIKTPHIDRLAAEGVRFEHGFATTASCGPSRAVIFSGLHAHQNGQYGHGHGYHTFRLMPNVRTIFQLLKEGGYHTALLGKQHVTPLESYPFDFDPKVNSRDVAGLATAAEQFFRESGDEPFFLAIGYSDPHPTSRDRPGWGIRKDRGGFEPVEYDPGEIVIPSYLPDRPEVREGLAGYYQQISRLDLGIGLVLDALEEAGKRDDTLVIFVSDHGSSEPGAMSNHYDPGVRIPFIVRHPKGQKPGSVNQAMVTLADIVPTVLDWTETAGPRYKLPGRSFLPILDQQSPPGWDEVYLSHVCHEVTMYYPMRTVRTRQYKLIWNIDWRSEYPLPIDTLQRATWTETLRRKDRLIGPRTVTKFLNRDELELYDLENDPDEVINLAENPVHAAVRRELLAKLDKFVTDTKDPWMLRHQLPPRDIVPEPDENEGYQLLFNGQNLDGWILHRANRNGYVVEDGLLVCPADGGGYLFTEKEYADFSLRFEFRLTEAANNGIAVRTPLLDKKPAYDGIEIQILDNVGYPRQLRPAQYHGSIYDVVPAKRGALKPVGQWNCQEIICQGRRITVIVNEMVILNADLDELTDSELVETHPGLKRAKGHIGLLGHGSRVEFRNLRVKELLGNRDSADHTPVE
jgi:N-sulfoglucosamine sulfohydrolase